MFTSETTSCPVGKISARFHFISLLAPPPPRSPFVLMFVIPAPFQDVLEKSQYESSSVQGLSCERRKSHMALA